jgi:tryptophan synthase alpha chain
MSRIPPTLKALRGAGRKALIPYITAGDPSRAATVPLMHAMVRAGADVLELGVPFSDPMADGPVIQRSGERALKNGVSLRDVLGMVKEFRTTDATTPVVLMGYANPIEAIGNVVEFVRDAAAAGVDGLIVVDYPPEESTALAAAVRDAGMDLIFLLAPTSTVERVALVARLASGYLYYVSLAGVTGASHFDLADVVQHLAVIRRYTDLPIGVGFGIRDAATARAVAKVADAAIIGSRVIQEIEAAPQAAAERVGALLREIRNAMDAA